MTEMVLTDAFVSIAGVDFSDHVRSVTVNYTVEIKDKTAMGATAKAKMGGLKDFNVELELYQDYDASKVDATLYSLMGTSFSVIFRPDSASKGADNPEYTGNVILSSYNPLGGSVGEEHMTNISLDGNGDLDRSV